MSKIELNEINDLKMIVTLSIAFLFFSFGILLCVGLLNKSIFILFKSGDEISKLLGVFLILISFLFTYAFIKLLFQKDLGKKKLIMKS